MSLPDLSKMTIGFYDHGLFHHMAERMRPDFKEVLYYCPWKSGFPDYKKAIVGTRMSDITRVEEFAEHKAEIKESGGFIVFPDAGDGSDAQDLRDQGFKVVSTASADILEYDREFMKKILKKVGLPVLPYEMVQGWKNLLKCLELMESKGEEGFIKISGFRAVTETFKFTTLNKAMPHLYKIGFKLASYAPEMWFMIERAQEGIEPGSDQFLCLGEPLDSGVYGWEVKGRGYSGQVRAFSKMPEPMRIVDQKLIPFLKKRGASGLSSMESRIGKDLIAHPIDYCGRAGTPSSEVNIRNCKNFSHVMWGMANGERVKPEWYAEYVSEIILHSDVLTDNHVPVSFPDKVSKYVALRNAWKDKTGQIWCLDMDGGTMVGAACGWGKTKEESQEMALDVARQIDCPRLDYDDQVFVKCNKSLKEAEKWGLGGF
ncbi:MAG: hypothetical protein ABSG90_14105 [Dehalococcoidia bacterium]|jgi:hypothetical protein